jgi:hypothetical protein
MASDVARWNALREQQKAQSKEQPPPATEHEEAPASDVAAGTGAGPATERDEGVAATTPREKTKKRGEKHAE